MIKRTLYFGNPVYLSKKNDQLVIEFPEKENKNKCSIPLEDIGVVLLDNQQITITQGVLQKLHENNCAIISCNETHLPTGMFMVLDSHTLQTERFEAQLKASLPLRKQLWQQTIVSKINNQAELLKHLSIPNENMMHWAASVRSGDKMNHEARAAAYYWARIFRKLPGFTRDRFELPPNNLLNYGYAVLRATVARGLTASGLLPSMGIFHHNRYNAYPLADDIMEPYRPYVDKIVYEIVENETDCWELTPAIKRMLLTIPAVEIFIDGQRSPLMVGLQKTTSSLSKCFSGEQRKIIYPEFKWTREVINNYE